MPPLRYPDDRQVVDANGNDLKVGSLVMDDIFGEGFTRGTVSLRLSGQCATRLRGS